MSHIEDSIVNNIASFFENEINTAFRIMIASSALGLICWFPLLVFIAVGPADGNPVVLGLIAMLGTPIAAIGMGAGLIRWMVDLMLVRKG